MNGSAGIKLRFDREKEKITEARAAADRSRLLEQGVVAASSTAGFQFDRRQQRYVAGDLAPSAGRVVYTVDADLAMADIEAKLEILRLAEQGIVPRRVIDILLKPYLDHPDF